MSVFNTLETQHQRNVKDVKILVVAFGQHNLDGLLGSFRRQFRHLESAWVSWKRPSLALSGPLGLVCATILGLDFGGEAVTDFAI